MDRRFRLWTWWLVLVAGAALAVGLSPVLFPGVVSRLLGGLYLSNPDAIGAFGRGAAAYIGFVTAVLGAVLAGWAAAILCVLAFRFRAGNRDAWSLIAASVLVWFIPDTAYSLLAGFWQNAVFNVVVLAMFAVPLAATFRASFSRDTRLAGASVQR